MIKFEVSIWSLTVHSGNESDFFLHYLRSVATVSLMFFVFNLNVNRLAFGELLILTV